RVRDLGALVAANDVAPGGSRAAGGDRKRVCRAAHPHARPRNALNLALHRLRKLLGDDKLVRLDKGSLSLDEQRTWVDAWSLERLCAEVDKWGASSISSIDEKPAALAARLLGLYGADFLSGEDATWALVARERLRSKFMRS